jgi:hypothetical protein
MVLRVTVAALLTARRAPEVAAIPAVEAGIRAAEATTRRPMLVI